MGKSNHIRHLEVYQAIAKAKGWKEEHAALTAAIAALEAVENADKAFVHNDNEIIHEDAYNAKYYGRVLIIPDNAAGGGK